MRWINNPATGRQDPMLTMSVVVVLVASIKFLFAGIIVISASGATVNLGNIDATVYAALMGPVLAYHGYVRGKGSEVKGDEK